MYPLYKVYIYIYKSQQSHDVILGYKESKRFIIYSQTEEVAEHSTRL